MFQLGLVLLVAFMGAALAVKARLSAMIAYLLVGILMGPHMALRIGPLEYRGVVTDPDFLREVSQVGLILLLFFVGLNFPMSKLRRTKTAAAILAVINLAINMFAGLALGRAFGWPLPDTLFLAGVVSMSSSSVTAKALMDLNRLNEGETDFLLGMVILESFMAMFLLTAINGLVLPPGDRPEGLLPLVLGIAVFLAFFAFLALLVVPRLANLFQHMKNDELFILSSLGMVFLAAALAEAFFIPSIIGAFFMGMAFAETKLHDRLASRMESLRDAFVAFFFISFGMAIDPALFPGVAIMVLVALPLIFLTDVLLTGMLAYLLGFGSRAALDISTGLLGRNEESILYAGVGTRAIQANPGLDQGFGARLLNPFASLVCILSSCLVPVLMKRSARLAILLRRLVPSSWRFGGEVIRTVVRDLVLPPPMAPRRSSTLALLAALGFTVYLGALMILLPGGYNPLILALALPVLGGFWIALRRTLKARRPRVVVTNLGLVPPNVAQGLASTFVLITLATTVGVALLWPLAWQASLVLLAIYVASVHGSLRWAYRRSFSVGIPGSPFYTAFAGGERRGH